MKRSGFTLVELIVTITLLFIIGIVVVFNLNKSNMDNKENDYEYFVRKIESSANVYATGNNTIMSLLESDKGYVMITVKQLMDEGLLNEDLINPKTNELVIKEDKKVKVVLDDSGTIKIEYPGINRDNYLQALDIYLKIDGDKGISCFEDLNTYKLGYIDSEGNIVKDYLKIDENIKCLTDINSIDLNKLGTYEIKYSYKTTEGVWKNASRSVVVIDSIPPVISNIVVNPTSLTNGSVKINAHIDDYESGISGYTINEGNTCGTFKNSTNKDISLSITKNSDYIICAKDIAGNVTKSDIIKVNNIDIDAPKISVNSVPTGYTEGSINVTGSITDVIGSVNSGNISYTITNSNSIPSSYSNNTSEYSVNFSIPVSNNGTYYIHTKDALGNHSVSNAISISSIVTTASKTLSGSELNSSFVSGSFRLSGSPVRVKSISNLYGSLSSSRVSISGSNISYSGSASSYNSTCSTEVTRYASSYTPSRYCSSAYCPNGGSLTSDKSQCTGRSYDLTTEGTNYYYCSCSKIVDGFGGSTPPKKECDRGYTRGTAYISGNGCGSIRNGATCYPYTTYNCNNDTAYKSYNRKSCTNTWKATCTFNTYTSSCTGYSYNSCKSGEYSSGNQCYYCTGGARISGSRCISTESTSCTKYRYSFTIYFLVLK